jgi:hypothetical protein
MLITIYNLRLIIQFRFYLLQEEYEHRLFRYFTDGRKEFAGKLTLLFPEIDIEL